MSNGLGTPFLNIYDSKGNLLLDRVLVADGSYRPLAIDTFTYTFCETADDTGSITLISNSPEFLDRLNLLHYQKIYLEWGFLGGTKRSRLAVVVRNLKESYTSDGFKLILEISDKLASTKTSNSSVIAKLTDIKEHIQGLSTEAKKSIGEFEAFTSPPDLPEFDPDYIGNGNWQSTNAPYMEGNTDYTPAVITLPLSELNKPTKEDFYGPEPIRPPSGAGFYEQAKWAKDYEQWEMTGQGREALAGTMDLLERSYQTKVNNLGIINSVEEVVSGEDSENEVFTGGETKAKILGLDENSNPIYATGNNGTGVIQDYMDKTSDEPTSVTGEEDNLKIIKRKKQALEPPKDTYIFKGDDGRFLEFSYDSDANYANDTNVLRTLNINPETGAITTTDYTPTTQKIVDVYNASQQDAAEWDAMAQKTLINRILADPDRQADKIDVIKSVPKAINGPGERRFDGGYNATVDETRVVTSYVAIGLNSTEEALAIIDKEIKNQKMNNLMRNKASATFYGDPNLSNGYNVLLKGLSQKRNGTYHITSCTHSFSSKAGYQVVCEMYKVNDIPLGINTYSTTTGHSDVKARAKNLQYKSLGDLQKLQDKLGYVPIEDIASDSFYPGSPLTKGTKKYYKALKQIDSDYITILGYTDYTIQFHTNKGKQRLKIRIPNDTKTGGQKVFGDIFDQYDLYHIDPSIGWNANIIILRADYVPPAKKKY